MTSYAEDHNKDASAVYIEGKKARQIGKYPGDCTYEFSTPFYIHWMQGWNDEDTLIRTAMGDKDGSSGAEDK